MKEYRVCQTLYPVKRGEWRVLDKQKFNHYFFSMYISQEWCPRTALQEMNKSARKNMTKLF